MKLFMPVRLLLGEGCVKADETELGRLGRSCLIVCSPAAKRCGAFADAVQALERQGIDYGVYDSVKPNPSVRSCIEAGESARAQGARFVLGIGGGSAMDAAKAVSVFAANPGLDESAFYEKRWESAPLDIALIGTTAGTGSEVTMVSVLTDAKGRKHSIHDERMYAKVAFGDAAYLSGIPHGLAVSTGIDALSHCVESYFSKKANDFSRAYASEGVRILLAPLGRLLAGETGRSDQERLYLGSIYSGLAINLTGTCFPHNLGYYLTERFGLPHGTASAAFLEDLISYEAQANPDAAEAFFERSGTNREALCALIRKSVDTAGVFVGREELEQILPRWEDNSSVKNTLGDVGMQQIRHYLSKFVKEA